MRVKLMSATSPPLLLSCFSSCRTDISASAGAECNCRTSQTSERECQKECQICRSDHMADSQKICNANMPESAEEWQDHQNHQVHYARNNAGKNVRRCQIELPAPDQSVTWTSKGRGPMGEEEDFGYLMKEAEGPLSSRPELSSPPTCCAPFQS